MEKVSSANDAELVANAVTKYIGTKEHWPTTGGYGERVDLALINAVMSIQARFGRQLKNGSFNGVRGAVERYRSEHNGLTGDWFETLAKQDEKHLLELLTHSKFKGGRSKALAITEAAQAFVDAELKSRAAILADPTAAKTAYTSVHGLGKWTYEYFTMLIGEDSVKVDVWIGRFVSRALGRQVSDDDAADAVKGAAKLLECRVSELDHAIWSYGSTSRLRDMPRLND